MKSINPPKVLYFGSNTREATSLLETGLKPIKGDFVVLNQEKDPCIRSAKKTGKPVVFSIDSKTMAKDGFKFFIQKGGVWFIDQVPPQYLSKK
ncbi:MAG: RNA 2'-phosphotransferase [Candidatus Cloacimonetes bacterium]|nr:RNA 2'-phosphotransferase [Candidatus Cloacimonadota bacterium]